MLPTLADIALPLPLPQTFTYRIPDDCAQTISVGMRVRVPFGTRTLTGIVVSLPGTTTVKQLKPLRDILDIVPTFSPEMLSLTRWIADYYVAPWGEVLKAAMPQGYGSAGRKVASVIPERLEEALAATTNAPKQNAVLKRLAEESLSVEHLADRVHVHSIHSLLATMVAQGWIDVREEIVEPKAKPKKERIVAIADVNAALRITPKQKAVLDLLRSTGEPMAVAALVKRAGVTLSTVQTLVKKGVLGASFRETLRSSSYDDYAPAPTLTLNSAQSAALQTITAAVETEEYRTFLFHGITGSGKTQVYIEAIRNVLAKGKTAIVLVPEISLTPQTVRRFKSHFGTDVAVMHSQMSIGERYDAWRQARDGRVKIVIGPRSAIFAPLANVGLIVVDEEHEASYKQFDASPRYNARDVAIVRALQRKAVVVLGSATPSVESYANALAGKYELLELSERVDGACLPEVEIVDLLRERHRLVERIKEEVKQGKREFPKHLPVTSLSETLVSQIRDRLRKREGVILLQNRRGFSHVVECRDCGYVERCHRCEVSLTYHATKKHLRCHYCGIVKKPPDVCPSCGGVDIGMHAFGTQQVEEELRQLFPGATIARMDRDTTTRRGAHDRILEAFGSGKTDILLGTQMVAKGLDFPRVTLVGVISADTQILLPDFRSGEETFQLLTQVAGRAGRSVLPGEVVIQTLQPNHYSLRHVVGHDFRGFYEEELKYRQELQYPPYSRLALVEFSGVREEEVERHARMFEKHLEEQNRHGALVILGPADAAIPRLRNRFRKHIVIKNVKSLDPSGAALRDVLAGAVALYRKSTAGKKSRVETTIDVDPRGMM